jgi:peptide/nickel transport system ATP-binding protein
VSETVEREERTGTGEVLVDVRELGKYYDTGLTGTPVKAVDGVDFDIRRGETLGLVGESGCGKTTLGRTLVQLETATEGEIRFDDRDVTDLSGSELKRWRRNAQIVFQDPESSLNDRMTVGEIVREPLDVHDWPNLSARVEGTEATVTGDVEQADPDARGRDVDITVRVEGDRYEVDIRDEIPLRTEDVEVRVDREGGGTTVHADVRKTKGQIRRAHVRDLLETVGLREEHYYRYPHQFSGGQRQRIGIARALSLEPEFVVLDEPVSALDVSVQAKILNLLEDLQAQFELTYLFIAHDLSVVRHICDRVAVMYLGNIMELGPTEALFRDPANPYTISLLSAIPEPDPTAEGARVTLRGTPPSPRFPPAGCPFSTRCPAKIRPEDYRDLDPAVWRSIEVFTDIVRERQHADRSLREIARERLGMETRFSDVEETVLEVFAEDADVPAGAGPEEKLAAALSTLPPDVRDPLRGAVDRVRNNDEAGAMDELLAAFGSVCDDRYPDRHAVGDGHTSLCHRHEPEYESPQETISDRHGVR